ncbi:hypothetical protein [Vibrio splendidus]|uniref:hypothetical protein n=1 Tax=Vibrio splendidus TaxID=29497 RepID=UPI0015E67BA0|nr:hypothetical protein [Vibrio splendidus]
MKLYENVVIGNFLYGLGYSLGLSQPEKKQLSVINLLQQTPADKELGDMLLEFPGVVRLIEFKNSASSLEKEKKRCEQLTVAIGDREFLKRISREVHWYVETKPFEEICLNNIKPYLDAFSVAPSVHTIESFISDITKSVACPRSTILADELEAYLALVSKCQGSGKIGTGGLIISVSKGGLRYVQFSDIMELRLQHKDFVMSVEKEYNSVMKKLENELVKEKTLINEKTIDRGFSL